MGEFTLNSYPLQIICFVTFFRECKKKENPMNRKVQTQTISEVTKGQVLQYSMRTFIYVILSLQFSASQLV